MNLSESFSQAAQLQLQGKNDEALALYNEILQQDPNNPDVLHMLGLCFFQKGMLEEAESFISRAVELVPDNHQQYANLGKVLQAQEKWADAQTLYITALEIEPTNQDAMLGLGITSSQLGLRDVAISWLERFVALNPMHLVAYIELSKLKVPGITYLQVLWLLHQWLKPKAYVEIGVESGQSLALAEPPTNCVGIDPFPKIRFSIKASSRVFAETSDDFFQNHDLATELQSPTFDLAFIDGLHEFDAALRDFMNVERFAGPNSIVTIHDCCPIDGPSSQRERITSFWTGDTWRLVALLRKYRPDLTVLTFPANPSGLGIVMNLNPSSTTLIDNYDAIVAEFMAADISMVGKNYAALNLVSPDVEAFKKMILEYVKAD